LACFRLPRAHAGRRHADALAERQALGAQAQRDEIAALRALQPGRGAQRGRGARRAPKAPEAAAAAKQEVHFSHSAWLALLCTDK